jgi:hypothetical protein
VHRSRSVRSAPRTSRFCWREQEPATLPWDAAQKAAFVQMPFAAQHVQYQEHYAGADFDVILVDTQPADGSMSPAGPTRSTRPMPIIVEP